MADIYIVENIRFRTHQTDAKKLGLTYQNMVGN